MGGRSLLSDLPWLKPLLQTEFWTSCECMSSKYCNFFCRECMGSAFCEDCLDHPNKHAGHESLRVYKSSSKPGIRVRSIKNLLDVSDIQPYTCNASKLVYINKKGRKEHENRGINNGRKGEKCEVCGYELQYFASKFCSIECKVKSEVIEVKQETEIGEEEEEEDDPISTTQVNPNSFKKRSSKEEEDDDPISTTQVNRNSFRKRSRKGVPQRSPFF